MGNQIANLIFKKGEDAISAKYANVNLIPVTTIIGDKGIIGDYVQGKKLYLIVNVASK